MRSGDLRHQIVIEQRSASQDSFGDQVQTWTTVTTTYADIVPLSGRELQAAQSISTEVSHQIRVRYNSNIASFSDPKLMAALRVRFGNRLFNIHASLNVDERNNEMNFLASEGLNLG